MKYFDGIYLIERKIFSYVWEIIEILKFYNLNNIENILGLYNCKVIMICIVVMW